MLRKTTLNLYLYCQGLLQQWQISILLKLSSLQIANQYIFYVYKYMHHICVALIETVLHIFKKERFGWMVGMEVKEGEAEDCLMEVSVPSFLTLNKLYDRF